MVLDFWATWCPPCRKEIPHFIELVNDPGAGDLVVIGISRESEETLAAFAQEQGINYPVASAEDLPAPFGEVRSIPTTFFVDRNGVIQTVFEGYRDFQTLKDAALAEDFKGEAADLPVLDAPEIDPAPAASGAGAESPPAAGP